MSEYGSAPKVPEGQRGPISAERLNAKEGDWEKELLEPARRTIFVPAVPGSSHATARVDLRDAIAAVQNAGYLVYEIGELPEVIECNTGTSNVTRPRLPAHYGEVREGVDQRTAYYEEAFGKLALARWWEKEAERRSKRQTQLAGDIYRVSGNLDGHRLAVGLVERGWRRG